MSVPRSAIMALSLAVPLRLAVRPYVKEGWTIASLVLEVVDSIVGRRIVVYLSGEREGPMSVMCSLAVCKAQQGLCGHEKVMLSVAVLAAIGFGAYFLIG